MRSVMRFGTRVQKLLKCAICHVRVGNLHADVCMSMAMWAVIDPPPPVFTDDDSIPF